MPKKTSLTDQAGGVVVEVMNDLAKISEYFIARWGIADEHDPRCPDWLKRLLRELNITQKRVFTLTTMLDEIEGHVAGGPVNDYAGMPTSGGGTPPWAEQDRDQAEERLQAAITTHAAAVDALMITAMGAGRAATRAQILRGDGPVSPALPPATDETAKAVQRQAIIDASRQQVDNTNAPIHTDTEI